MFEGIRQFKAQSEYLFKMFVSVIIIGLSVGIAYWYFNDEEATLEEVINDIKVSTSTLEYVSMTKPFIFQITTKLGPRLVQINVQLAVRGLEYQEVVRRHIPLFENEILQALTQANSDLFLDQPGRNSVRNIVLRQLNIKFNELAGKEAIEMVLFTGFVMQ